jgi:hypothetical protein
MGCFADKWDVHDITPVRFNYPGMTVEYCIGYCSRNSYSVAGVQYRFVTQ